MSDSEHKKLVEELARHLDEAFDYAAEYNEVVHKVPLNPKTVEKAGGWWLDEVIDDDIKKVEEEIEEEIKFSFSSVMSDQIKNIAARQYELGYMKGIRAGVYEAVRRGEIGNKWLIRQLYKIGDGQTQYKDIGDGVFEEVYPGDDDYIPPDEEDT